VKFQVPVLDFYGVVSIGEEHRFKAAWEIFGLRNRTEEQKGLDVSEIESLLEAAEGALRAGQYSVAEETIRLAIEAEAAMRSEEPPSTDVLDLPPIVVDGSLGDWAGFDPTATDSVGDTSRKGTDIEAVYAARDSEYLYVAAQVRGENPYVNFELDYDGDGQKEFVVHGRAADRAADIWRSDQGDDTPAGEVLAEFGEVLELRVPLGLIESPERIAIHVSGGTGKPEYAISDDVPGWFEVRDCR